MESLVDDDMKARLVEGLEMMTSERLPAHLNPYLPETGSMPLEMAVRSNAILRLTDNTGNFQFPKFQFGEGGTLSPVVQEVNMILGANLDPWAALHWWVSSNPWLPGNPAPMSLVRTDAQDILPQVARTLLG